MLIGRICVKMNKSCWCFTATSVHFSWKLQWIACIGMWSASNNPNKAHLVLIEWFEDKYLAQSDRLTDLCEPVCTVSVCTCCCWNARRISAFLRKMYHEHFTNQRWGACLLITLRLHFRALDAGWETINNHDVYSVLKLYINNYWEHVCYSDADGDSAKPTEERR